MARIVCVSNRVSLPDPVTGQIKAGGLAVGVKAALEGNGGGVWFGWNGAILENGTKRKPGAVTQTEKNGITFLTLPLTRAEYDDYYKKMANEGLWPFMHELAEHIDEDGSSYDGYEQVNNLFALELQPHLTPNDIIWVHDYHLIPLGRALRNLGVENRICFFNHIPIPGMRFIQSPAVSTALRFIYDDLVRSLFSYNQVGFQTFRDFHNFADYVGYKGPAPSRFSTAMLNYHMRHTRFGVFPISIETAILEEKAVESSEADEIRRMKERMKPYKVLIGAERLDYTKGLVNRINGVSKLLAYHPEYDHKIKYIQVTPLSRDDITQYRRTIDRTRAAVDNIQQRYGDEDWQPVIYSEQSIDRDHLIGYFRHADVGLVTPLMDGQNLIAKEFLAAQDPADPGMLVLSKNAGAAEELGELGAALLVDPRNPDDIADQIDCALKTPHHERAELHGRAMDYLRRYDINHWARSFLGQAGA